MKECLQLTYGKTPCFRDADPEILKDELPCKLDSCPVITFLDEHPDTSTWTALHQICVITDPFDYKGNLKSIQLKLISLKKKRK